MARTNTLFEAHGEFCSPWASLRMAAATAPCPVPPGDAPLRKALRVYRAALPLAALFFLPGLVLRMVRRGNYQNNFKQRFGLFDDADLARLRASRWTWIRSISVGETLVALKLARALRAAQPDIQIALSVTTSTGYALACEHACEWLFPLYNPVDSLTALRRTLDALHPERLVLIEGEIWPNLAASCLAAGVPILLANARLSARSAGRFARFHRWVSPFFKLIQWAGVPETADLPRWAALGVPPENIEITGSLKFDQAQEQDPAPDFARELLSRSGVPENAPLLVAGSTHDGEERLLFECFQKWRERLPDLRLLIAPRHVERTATLRNELQRAGAKVCLRSELPDSDGWDTLLLNTTGELRSWYPLARLAFVGKSLTAHGGQNPGEPALVEKPVVFGPNMENFQGVVDLLLRSEGGVQVRDAAHLEQAVGALLADPERCVKMGRQARQALAGHQGATRRTAEAVLRFHPRP